VGVEIERRFMIEDSTTLPPLGEGVKIIQCYLPAKLWLNYWPGEISELEQVLADPLSTYRFRVHGDAAIATAKNRSDGPSRLEFEKEIPLESVLEIVHSGEYPSVEKTRYKIPTNDGLFWEIDCFEGNNSGLTIAEIEIPTPEHPIDLPNWIGRELTGQDDVWSNYALAMKLYDKE
jgi:adenylate cyclase|tara:strand:+ start:176 stop:703 length:528 start_codon:yes stop_codon:yes gene_type:complete